MTNIPANRRTARLIPPAALLPPGIPSLQLKEAMSFLDLEDAHVFTKGQDITAAFIDTGIFAGHDSLNGRVLDGIRLRNDGSTDDDTSDPDGHGTAVAGCFCSLSTNYPGVAPEARILPIRLELEDGAFDLARVADALEWIIDQRSDGKDISIVNLSLGDDGNYRAMSDVEASTLDQPTVTRIKDAIDQLFDDNVAILTTTGNGYRAGQVSQGAGMSFPAIVPKTISVGAVALKVGFAGHSYGEKYGFAEMLKQQEGWIAPFAQRLPLALDGQHGTRTFAPGSPINTLGHENAAGITEHRHGTSLATPMVAGVVALLQQKYREKEEPNSLPTISQLMQWIEQGGGARSDPTGEDGIDNVEGTGGTFTSINALGALQAQANALS